MELINLLISEGAIIFYTFVIIAIFVIFAIDMALNEMKERALDNLLKRKMEIDEYLKVVSEYSAKSRSKSKITKYNIYKAIGHYYKDEKDKALEWLKYANLDVEQSDDINLKILYSSTIIKILFRLGYNENVETLYQSRKPILDKMLTMKEFACEIHYIYGLYNLEKSEYKIAYEEFIEARKKAFTRIDKTMIAYQLARTCVKLDKLEEAEKETEEVMKTKHSAKNNLFIYDDLDKIIKEVRAKSNTISSVDKDLEEEKQLEALDKMNKEVEEAISDETIGMVKKNDTKDKDIDPDVAKLKAEEEFKNQLDQMTKNLHDEMLVQNNINK